MKRGLVGFSQFMGSWSMLSLGAVVGIGIWNMSAMAAVMGFAGDDSPLSLALATVIFVPVILCLMARASETREGSTPYAIVRRRGSPPLLFATGWLSLAGYVAVAALMVESIGIRASQQLDLFVGLKVPLIVLVAPVTVIAGLSEILMPNEHPKLRSATRWGLVFSVISFLIWVAIFPPPVTPGIDVPRLEASRWLSVVALPAAGLWVVELLLDHRPQFRSSNRKFGLVLVASWVLCGCLAICTAVLAVRHPDMLNHAKGIDTVVWERDRLKLLISACLYAIATVTLVKCLTRATRLAGSMAVDGLLPEAFQQSEARGRLPSAVLVALSVIVSVLGAWWSNTGLLGVAAVSILWVAFIAIGLGMQRKETPHEEAFKLPLHPLFPLLALGACAFFSVIVPYPSVTVTGAWLALGFLVRPFFGREAVITSDSVGEGEEASMPDRHDGRVLVCLGPSTDEQTLVRIGASIAQSRGGDMLVMRVVALLEQLPRAKIRQHAEEVWASLDGLLTEVVSESLAAYPVVRVAPNTESGLAEATKRYSPELVLLDYPNASDPSGHEQTLFLKKALETVAQSIVLVRGPVHDTPRRILGAVSAGPDSPTVLKLGEALAKAANGTLTAAHTHVPLEDEAVAQARLDAVLEESAVDANGLLIEAESPSHGLSSHNDEYDLLVMGCTRDRSASATLTGDGLLAETIAAWKGPLMLVRRREPVTARWIYQLWNQAFMRLPTLSVGERSEVYMEMRHSAAANVDFYVLIVIASAIATFGLVQNSAAVIIGAMLVAPLMSPIVAISLGIVQGNLSMIRRGLASTAKGSAVSIAVATGFVLVFPALQPTEQIMSRTTPTLFDLGIGLAAGAAAAYSVSRKAVSAAITGTAISVALVPPLCVVGIGLASDRLDMGVGALLLFLTNLAAIVFVSVVVFLLLGFFPRDKDRHSKAKGAIVLNLLALMLLSVPLGISSCHTTRIDALEVAVGTVFRSRAESKAIVLRNLDVDETDGLFVVTAAIYADTPITQALIGELREEVEAEALLPVRLELFVVHADRFISGPEEP